MSHEENNSFAYVASVRFKNSMKSYSFGTNDASISKGDDVVVDTIRGFEVGRVDSESVKAEDHPVHLELKPIVRKASEADLKQVKENKYRAKEALLICEQLIKNLNLDMQLVGSEYTLDKSKLSFVYVADQRVDFRDLLKLLNAQFKARIELRQIGQRDKAKFIGGIGICGQETCCSRFMNEFEVISINMAKNQMLALNTQKLSGQCGKLMCCLKHENDQYTSCRKGLPKLNESIVYRNKRYKVNSIQCCSNTINLYDSEQVVEINLDEFKTYYNQDSYEKTK